MQAFRVSIDRVLRRVHMHDETTYFHMSDKHKIQALPQGRATDEWLLRHVVDVMEDVLAAVSRVDERLDALERRVRDIETGSPTKQ